MSPDVPEDRGGFPSGMESINSDYIRRICLFRDDEIFDLARGRELREYNACAYGIWVTRFEIDDDDF
jgi:hypothetical protein